MHVASAKMETIFLSIQILAIALIAVVAGMESMQHIYYLIGKNAESVLTGLACESKEFPCSDEETCIPMEKFCDQNKDCPWVYGSLFKY